MTRRRIAWQVAGVCVLLAGLAILVFGRADGIDPMATAPAVATGRTPGPDVASAAPGRDAGVATPPPSAVVFPPRDTPIAEMIRLLQPAADAGDVRAQCRLAAELQSCVFAEMHVQWLLAEAARARSTGEDDAQGNADLDAAFLDLHAQCRALPADMAARGDAWLAAAAHAGHAESMIHYIEGMHLLTRSSHDFMAHPEFERWRRDAPVMLQRLLRAGEPEAVFLLMITAGGDIGLSSAVIPDDPLQQTAAMILQRRLSGTTHTAPPLTNRDPDVLRRAEALAARWHRDYYDDRLLPRNGTARRMSWLPAFMGGEHSPWREPCSD